MNQYPINTRLNWKTRPKPAYRHLPNDNLPQIPLSDPFWIGWNQQEFCPDSCQRVHQSLRQAYHCKNNPGHSDQIFRGFQEKKTYESWRRLVSQDELVINGLKPPTASSHALLVNLQLRSLPELDEMLRKPDFKKIYLDPFKYGPAVATDIYHAVFSALMTLDFYTTKPPKGFSANEFLTLLPTDQQEAFCPTMDGLVAETIESTSLYNQSPQRLQDQQILPEMLSYSLEPFFSER